MKITIFPILLLFTLLSATKAEEKLTLFTAPFSNLTKESKYDHAVVGFGDLIGVLLATDENIVLVERLDLDVVNAERRLKSSGLTDTGNARYIALAKELKADTMLVGHLSLDEKDQLIIGVKAIEIETERVVAVDLQKVENSDFDQAVQTLTNRFAEKLQITLPELTDPTIEDRPMASLYFGKGLSFFYSGNLDAAIMNFTRTLRLDPDYVEAHYFSGLAYYNLKEPKHAAIEWRALKRKKPEFELPEQATELLEKDASKRNDSKK